MYECDACSRGFHFASQLQEHKRVHQTQGDWVCFKPKCGKRFKRESELNAHLLSHNKKELQCVTLFNNQQGCRRVKSLDS